MEPTVTERHTLILTEAERKLVAWALQSTRVSRFSRAERDTLNQIILRLGVNYVNKL